MIWRESVRRRGRAGGAISGARRRLSTLAFSVLALAAVTGVAAGDDRTARAAVQPDAHSAAPQTMRKAIWGPQRHNGFSMFPIYRDLGVGIYQTMARWDAIAPTRPADPTDPSDPAYRWPAYLDEAVAEAATYGMEVQIMILGAPRWSNGGRGWQWVPHRPADYADFAATIARRYPSVRHWMIWGEPNRKPVFKPFTRAPRNKEKLSRKQRRAPRNYAKLLDAAYRALKSVDPANLVIGGNTYSGAGRPSLRPYQWIRHMRLPGGRRPRMDLYGHNPHTVRKPNLKARERPSRTVGFSDLRRLTRELDRNLRGRRPKLFISEWAIAAGPGYKRVKPKKQARWIRAGLRIVQRWKRIYTIGWAVPLDRRENRADLIGLMTANGDPKPAYWAFKSGLRR